MSDDRADAILSIILQAQAPPKRRPLLRTLSIGAAAAAAAALVFAGIRQLQPLRQSQPQLAVVMEQDILPAANGALLTLGNGQTIPLDSLQQGVIAQQGELQ